MFRDGAELSATPQAFQQKVAELKFVICVETTIEAKHARVTKEIAMKASGPVRVSLSNRLPLLERHLVRGHADLVDIVKCFDASRTLRSSVIALSFDQHPSLLAAHLRGRGATPYLHPVLVSVLYNVNLISMYGSKTREAALNRKRKEKEARRDKTLANATRGNRKKESAFDLVEEEAMRQHLVQVLDIKTTYSCRANLLRLESLASILSTPATRRLRPMPNTDGELDLRAQESDDEERTKVYMFSSLEFPTLGKRKPFAHHWALVAGSNLEAFSSRYTGVSGLQRQGNPRSLL